MILPLVLFLAQANADSTARDTLNQALQFYGQDSSSTSAQGLPATEAAIEKLNQDRLSPIEGTSSIADGPFVGYIVQNELLPSYSSIEQSQYPAAYASNVTNATLEDLFDTFMGQIEGGGLTGAIAKAGNEVGACLAKKVEEGKSDSCPLDVTDAPPTNKPGIFKLAMMKLTCRLPFKIFDPCKIRQAVYAVAKPELITMRPQWPGIFNDAYPGSFRSTILNGVNTDRATIGQIVTQKFGGAYQASYWNQAPLIDLDDTTNRTMTMHEFASGMSNDLRAASILSQSSDETTKGLAGALFYAGANRLLVLMGGTETKWDPNAQWKDSDDEKQTGQFVPVPGDAFDSKNPLASPQFQTEPFGGLTSLNGKMTALDIANYSPTAGAVQLFPSQLILGLNGVATPNGPVVETLQDLGDLMNSLIDFMTLSTPSSALSPHFVSASSINDLIDPTKPALFPVEGRQLAAGLIAAIFQNVLVDNGHLQQPPASNAPTPPADPDHDGVFGLKFYDQVNASGRLPGKVSIDSLSTLFRAASRFNALMVAKDSGVPDALMKLQDQVAFAIQMGVLTIAANGQASDGGFVDNLGDTQMMSNRSLSTCVNALRALAAGYATEPSGAIRQAVHAGWAFLDRYWAVTSSAGLPLAMEPPAKADLTSLPAASTETAWALMNLWTETKNSGVYADLMNPALDQDWATTQGWDKWASRFSTLQKGL
jgi:hypothetical protein